MIRNDDVCIGGLVIRAETETEPCGMGDSLEFKWHSVYGGDPDPYKGPLAKFKVRQHAEVFAAAAEKANTCKP